MKIIPDNKLLWYPEEKDEDMWLEAKTNVFSVLPVLFFLNWANMTLT